MFSLESPFGVLEHTNKFKTSTCTLHSSIAVKIGSAEKIMENFSFLESAGNNSNAFRSTESTLGTETTF